MILPKIEVWWGSEYSLKFPFSSYYFIKKIALTILLRGYDGLGLICLNLSKPIFPSFYFCRYFEWTLFEIYEGSSLHSINICFNICYSKTLHVWNLGPRVSWKLYQPHDFKLRCTCNHSYRYLICYWTYLSLL